MRPVILALALTALAALPVVPALASGPKALVEIETEPVLVVEEDPGRGFLGIGRLFTNDHFGDEDDRWRTGSYQFSLLRGPAGLTSLPGRFGALVEFRFGGAVLAPSNLTNPNPADRRYAGVLWAGLHSHFAAAGAEFSLGADLVATGPMTGVGRFHVRVHEVLGMVPPSAATLAAQIPNHVYPTAVAEAGRRFRFGENLTLRPFVEAQAGAETFVRIGGDILIGPAYSAGVWLRDAGTGHLYQGLSGSKRRGLAFTIGGDVARVFSSAYLPASGGYTLTPLRTRARAGITWQGEKVGVFYGVTWLGREFQAQPEGQIVGSLRVRIEF